MGTLILEIVEFLSNGSSTIADITGGINLCSHLVISHTYLQRFSSQW